MTNIERTQLETSLLASEARLRLALAAARMGTWDRDLVTDETTWSPETERLFGLAPGSFPGTQQAFLAYVHPRDRDWLESLLQRQIEERTGVWLEFRIVRPDGAVRWLASRAEVQRNKAGLPSKLLGVAMDITERKLAEQALLRSEANARNLLQVSHDIIWTVDLGGCITSLSQPAVYGYQPEELLGHPFTEFLPPEQLEAGLGEFHKVLAGGTSVQFESVFLSRDGTPVYLSSNAIPLYDEQGNPIGAMGASSDITARKRAEEGLRQSEERYRVVLDAAQDAVISIGPRGEILLVNPAATQIFGYAAPEMVGQPLTMLIPERLRQPHQRALRRYLLTGERHVNSQGIELIGLRNDGVEFPIEVSFGEVVASGRRTLAGIIRDISSRKRAEQAIAQLAALVESSGDAIIGTTLDGTIVSWNAGAERLYGYAAEEVLGQSVDIVMPTECQDELPAVLASIKGGRAVEHFEALRMTRDGRRLYVSIAVSPIRDVHGNICGASRISHDISTRKAAQAALRESEERFRQLAENVRQAFWVADWTSGKTLYVSPAYEEIWGRRYAGFYQDSRAFLATVHPDDRARVEAAKEEQKRDLIPLQVEYRIVRPDGSIRCIWDRSSPVRDEKGCVYRFVGIAEDITARRSAEARQQHTLEQLRALAARLQSIREEERTCVAREMHDELGQALTAIKFELLSLLRGLPAAGELPSHKSAVVLRLIDEAICSVRRIATDLRPGVLDDLGLVATIEWAASEFQSRTGTKCELELPAEDGPISQNSATALFRIFQETLTNIARHARATVVHVRLAHQQNTVILEVHDNGIGVQEAQLSNGRSLGILGMHERALLLGGEFTIHGVPGHGTTVTVRIPREAPRAPEEKNWSAF